MAEASSLFTEEQFICPICLDVLKNPVTLTCGHSYCMSCIQNCWDKEVNTGIYSCPQCRQTFNPMPDVRKNTILAEVVEKLKKTALPDAAVPPPHLYAGAGDVGCDVCTGRKLKALKSCLMCLASYCGNHLKLHNEIHPGSKHKLVDPSGQLQDKICPHHGKVLEFYCCTDQKCICYLCMMDKHKSHDTVPAAKERVEKQEKLEEIQMEFQQRVGEKEKEVQELRQAVDSLTSSAQAAVEHSESIFTQLIRSMERRRSEVKELIRAQEKAAVSQAEGDLERLEQEIAELRRRDAELEKLIHTQDHIHLLQSCQTLCDPPGSAHVPSITLTAHASFDTIWQTLSYLQQQVEKICMGVVTEISDTVKHVHKGHSAKPSPRREVDVLHTPEPRSRDEFLHYACELTLDPNTVNVDLSLSEGNRVATYEGDPLSYPDHPERFDHWSQVLSRESLVGRCYWEVEWGGDVVDIAVTYKGINRKSYDNNSWLGRNDQSWSVQCSPFGYFFCHNNTQIRVPDDDFSRIGVYVDHSAGTLSFYSTSDTMTLLHRVQTTFTQPLYAGFWVYGSLIYGNSAIRLCSLR